MCPHYNVFVVVYSKQHCLQTEKYGIAQVVIDMYIPTKFHHVFICFYLVVCSNISKFSPYVLAHSL